MLESQLAGASRASLLVLTSAHPFDFARQGQTSKNDTVVFWYQLDVHICKVVFVLQDKVTYGERI